MRGKRSKLNKQADQNAFNTSKQNLLSARNQCCSFTWTFLISAALLLIPVSLIPEAWYGPLNRLTANLSVVFMRMMGMAPLVRGTNIRLTEFTVNVISECSAIHLIALFAAFILAFPGDMIRKLIGIAVGVVLISIVNSMRIGAITMIGQFYPNLFDVFHIYLGQLAMLSFVVFMCLFWCRCVSNSDFLERPAGFFLRFLCFSIVPFLLWLPLNRVYQHFVDGFVETLFSAASYKIIIPLTHDFYYQSFSLVTMAGLLFAVKSVKLSTRLRWFAVGFFVLTLLQIAIRICNTWITAFHMQWVEAVSQIIYFLCTQAIPLGIGLLFVMKVRAEKIQ
ncbi:exosortase H [uncultured Desulfobacter sp.]|uniref:exosortase H n=1 Tax=uncultured Desulfobacter sp. TaxID=240139 RepID=UPI0029F57B0F|nr:exosortase H [uncultured Desulfobacter sp.]